MAGGRNQNELDTAHSPKTNPSNMYLDRDANSGVATVYVGNFQEATEKHQLVSDQSKLDQSNHDSSPLMSMKDKNARLQKDIAPITTADGTIQAKGQDYLEGSPGTEAMKEGIKGNKFQIKVQPKLGEATEELKEDKNDDDTGNL